MTYLKLICSSASWVGDWVGWVTDIRQAWLALQTMLLAPNGPLVTANSTMTCPLASDVTLCMAAVSQSLELVAAPLTAHSMTTNDSPGEKPVAVTSTVCPELRPAAGVTVIFWVAAELVGDAEVAAGTAVEGAAVAEVAAGAEPERVSGPELLAHPDMSTASTPQTASQRRPVSDWMLARVRRSLRAATQVRAGRRS